MLLWCDVHTRDINIQHEVFFWVCVTFPICRYVVSVDQALDEYLIKNKMEKR